MGGTDYKRWYVKLFLKDLADKEKKYEEYSFENPKWFLNNILIGQIYGEPIDTVKVVNLDLD